MTMKDYASMVGLAESAPAQSSLSASAEALAEARGHLTGLAEMAEAIALRLSGPRPTSVTGNNDQARGPLGLVDAITAGVGDLRGPTNRLDHALSEIQRRIG